MIHEYVSNMYNSTVDPPEQSVFFAARRGDINKLKYLFKMTNVTDSIRKRGCAWAAMGGHLETVRWFRDLGFACDYEEIFYWAGGSGNVELLEFLYEIDCPYDPTDVYILAAENGHMDAIKWMDDHGFIYKYDDVANMAAIGSSWDIFNWAMQKHHRLKSEPYNPLT